MDGDLDGMTRDEFVHGERNQLQPRFRLVTVLCENIPAGILPADNEADSASSLENLAALVERV